MSIMNELCTTLWKDKLAIMPLDPPVNVTFGITTASGRHMSPAAEKLMEYAVKMLTREEKNTKNNRLYRLFLCSSIIRWQPSVTSR